MINRKTVSNIFNYFYLIFFTLYTMSVFGQACTTAPVNTLPPNVYKNQNNTLNVTNGLWSSSCTSYQWQLNGIDIPNATEATFNIATIPAGNTVRCKITVSNSSGSTIAYSNTISIDTGYNKNLETKPGYTLVNALSDEFNGNTLDTNKWYNYHTYWAGRGSTFTPSNVSVNNGYLQLKSSVLDTNQLHTLYNRINKRLTNSNTPVNLQTWNCASYGNNWNSQVLTTHNDSLQNIGMNAIGAACVMSKTAIAEKGYYEARIKTSKISMSSSYWLQGGGSEIDITESYGAVGIQSNNPYINSKPYTISTNLWETTNWISLGSTDHVNAFKTSDVFFVLGMEWNDNFVKIYVNDVLVMTRDLSSNPSVSASIFASLKYLFFDTEILLAPWLGWPSYNDLIDPTKNTFYVDWVRVWKPN
jgi:hypothetical protein